MSDPKALIRALGAAAPPTGGFLSSIRGLLAEADGLELPVGGLAEIETGSGFSPAEVVGFRSGHVQLVPLHACRGLEAGCRVWPLSRAAGVPAGEFLLGRTVDAMGQPLDGGPPFPPAARVPLYREPIAALERPVLEEPLDVGVRAINAAATVARGQRMGLFAGTGVGKSTLLGMMLRGTDADVRVLALIGERGREVREFIERELGEARQSTVVVAVPSDRSPLLRMRGAYVATAIAEHFRERGRDVLLLMDSITRFAFAAREIGLARGEPATTKGYTPSVFAELPALTERAGRLERGSVTAIYSVLVEGDDLEDPVADAMRGLLDGHIILSRDLAERAQFPAVDVLGSISRAMISVTDLRHRELAQQMRRLLAAYRDAEDLIQVGAYAQGSDPVVDEAIRRRTRLQDFLRQDAHERASMTQTLSELECVLTEPIQ
ncbi:MAG: FliI/YscN family ATPase [Myxococcota bacterium]